MTTFKLESTSKSCTYFMLKTPKHCSNLAYGIFGASAENFLQVFPHPPPPTIFWLRPQRGLKGTEKIESSPIKNLEIKACLNIGVEASLPTLIWSKVYQLWFEAKFTNFDLKQSIQTLIWSKVYKFWFEAKFNNFYYLKWNLQTLTLCTHFCLPSHL